MNKKCKLCRSRKLGDFFGRADQVALVVLKRLIMSRPTLSFCLCFTALAIVGIGVSFRLAENGCSRQRAPGRLQSLVSMTTEGYLASPLPSTISFRDHTGGTSCAGVVIEDGWALSAYHCGLSRGHFAIGREGIFRNTERMIKDVCEYSDPYNSSNRDHDIVLVKLDKGTFVQPMRWRALTGSPCEFEFASWRQRIPRGIPSRGRLGAIDAGKCKMEFGDLLEGVSPRAICGTSCKDAVCKGDSGGPAFQQILGADELLGIISAVNSRKCQATTGLVLKIESYRTWIEGVIDGEIECESV